MNIASLVSVIVPIYNQEAYLNTCIRTIVKQTYTNLEILLIDDGSSDNSIKICRNWEKKDKRITVIRKSNGGIADARNMGLNNATGKYICFVDADDWIEENMVENMINVFERFDQVDLVFCNYRRVSNYEGNIVSIKKGCIKLLNKYQVVESIIEKNILSTYVWSGMYKKKLTTSITFPKNKNYEDMYTMMEFIKPCRKLAFIDKAFYNYRINNASISHKWSLKNLADYCDASINEAKLALEISSKLRAKISNGVILDMLYVWKEALSSDINEREYKYILKKIKTNINCFYIPKQMPIGLKFQVMVMNHLNIKKNGLVNYLFNKIIELKRDLK